MPPWGLRPFLARPPLSLHPLLGRIRRGPWDLPQADRRFQDRLPPCVASPLSGSAFSASTLIRSDRRTCDCRSVGASAIGPILPIGPIGPIKPDAPGAGCWLGEPAGPPLGSLASWHLALAVRLLALRWPRVVLAAGSPTSRASPPLSRRSLCSTALFKSQRPPIQTISGGVSFGFINLALP